MATKRKATPRSTKPEVDPFDEEAYASRKELSAAEKKRREENAKARMQRITDAKAEWEAIKEWHANGEQGEQPASPVLDSFSTNDHIQRKGSKTMSTKTSKSTKSTDPVDLITYTLDFVCGHSRTTDKAKDPTFKSAYCFECRKGEKVLRKLAKITGPEGRVVFEAEAKPEKAAKADKPAAKSSGKVKVDLTPIPGSRAARKATVDKAAKAAVSAAGKATTAAKRNGKTEVTPIPKASAAKKAATPAKKAPAKAAAKKAS